MKNETARREIESLDYYLQNHTDDYSEESHTAMMMAVKALEEQEPILDKIRAEIMKLQTYKMFGGEDTVYVEHEDVLAIIDKYRKSEDKDADKKCTYKETGCGSCKRQLNCPIEADTTESEVSDADSN